CRGLCMSSSIHRCSCRITSFVCLFRTERVVEYLRRLSCLYILCLLRSAYDNFMIKVGHYNHFAAYYLFSDFFGFLVHGVFHSLRRTFSSGSTLQSSVIL